MFILIGKKYQQRPLFIMIFGITLLWDVWIFFTDWCIVTKVFFPWLSWVYFCFWNIHHNCLFYKNKNTPTIYYKTLPQINIGHIILNLAWFLYWKGWNYTSLKEYWWNHFSHLKPCNTLNFTIYFWVQINIIIVNIFILITHNSISF